MLPCFLPKSTPGDHLDHWGSIRCPPGPTLRWPTVGKWRGQSVGWQPGGFRRVVGAKRVRWNWERFGRAMHPSNFDHPDIAVHRASTRTKQLQPKSILVEFALRPNRASHRGPRIGFGANIFSESAPSRSPTHSARFGGAECACGERVSIALGSSSDLPFLLLIAGKDASRRNAVGS